MQTQATPRERARAQMTGRVASIAFGDAAASLMTDPHQQRMDVAPLHVRAAELDTTAKYAIYALVTLIAALPDVIDSLCGSACAVNRAADAGAAEVHAMKTFLQFAWADRQYVIRKRQWPSPTAQEADSAAAPLVTVNTSFTDRCRPGASPLIKGCFKAGTDY